MIEINLVPENLRKKKKKRSFAGGESKVFPKETIIGVVVGLMPILLIMHAVFQVLIFMKDSQNKRYIKQIEMLAEEKEDVDAVLGDLKQLQEKWRSMEAVGGGEKIDWAQKLNDISDNIPRGVWLSNITLDGDVLLMHGSAVSKDQKNEDDMSKPLDFASRLKEIKSFAKDFENIEPGQLKRQTVNETKIVNFNIKADLKIEEEK